MNTIKANLNKTRAIAHRGVSGLETENTLAAFIAAGNRSYFGIETDLHVTIDGKFVIYHDDTLVRLTGVDKVIEQTTYEEIRALPVKDVHNGGKFRTDLRVPNLKEYIRICKKYEKVAVLELKNAIDPKHIHKIIEEIREEDYLENVIFISFFWENLIAVKAICPHQKVQFLTGECDDALIQKLVENEIDLDILYPNLTEDMVKKLKENHVEINVWTCDNKEDAERLANWGVDYLTTNIIE